MKIKRKDIVNLYEIISSLSEEVKNIRDVKERYKIAKNKKMLDEEINVLRETMNSNVDQDIMAFEKERMNLIQLYAEKDENGNPIVNGGMVTFSKDNREVFEKAIEELEARYPNIKKMKKWKNSLKKNLMWTSCIKFLLRSLKVPIRLLSMLLIN